MTTDIFPASASAFCVKPGNVKRTLSPSRSRIRAGPILENWLVRNAWITSWELVRGKTIRKTIDMRKRRPQIKNAHLSEVIPCRGIDCEVEFLPIRKDQGFCSSPCRTRFFKTARSLGAWILKESRTDSTLNIIVDRFLKG